MRKTKRINLIFILLSLFFACGTTTPKKINVEINKNVETISILYLVADVGLNPFSGSLSAEAKEHFKSYKEHEAIKILNTIMDRIGFSEPITIVMYLSEVPKAKLIHKMDENFLKNVSGNDNVEKGRMIINQFISALNDFYQAAHVDDFIFKHKEYYDNTKKQVLKNLPDENFIKTMENFYGKKNSSYTLIPSPILYPFIGFGPRIKTQQGLRIYNIFGPLIETKDKTKYKYCFDNKEKIMEKSVHEFGHSFINSLTELPENVEKIQKFSYLFEPIRKNMKNQGYDNWWICVTEHLVRLGEIRISYALNDSAQAIRLREDYVKKRNFIYIPALEEKMKSYEQNRDKYKSFGDFLPELLETFAQIDASKI